MTMADEFIPNSTLAMLVEAMNRSNVTIDKLDGTIEGLRKDMDDKFVRKEVLEPQLDSMRKDITKHAGYWDWLVKIIAAIIIAALLSVVLIQGGHHL